MGSEAWAPFPGSKRQIGHTEKGRRDMIPRTYLVALLASWPRT